MQSRQTSGKGADALARVRALRAAGRIAEARAAADRYLRSHGADPAALHLAATLAWSAGDRPTALAHARKAARVAPRSYGVRLELARMLVLSQNPEGLEESAAALDLRPDDPAALFEHARLLFNGPRPGAAAPLLEAVAPNAPDYPEAQAMLAALHIADDRPDAALAAAEAAVAAGLVAAEIFEIRGRARLALDRPAEARRDFAAALRIEPERLLSLRGYSVASSIDGDLTAARRATAEHTRLLPFEWSGPEAAPLGVMVANKLGLYGVIQNLRTDRAYGVTNYMSGFEHPRVRLAHYVPNNVASTEIRERTGARLIFNNIGAAEMIEQGGGGARLAASFDAAGLPVINDVAAAEQTTRIGNYRRFRDSADFIYPRTERFEIGADPTADARRILEACAPPFLMRPVHTNNRAGLRLVGDADALLSDPPTPHMPVYVIAYHPSRFRAADGVDGAIHYRISVADGRIWPDRMSWAIADFTKVVTDRAGLKFEDRGLHEHERMFIEDPRAVFGRDLEEIFADVLRGVGLDVYGVDFGRTADGRVVVFEINAAMSLMDFGHRLDVNPYLAGRREAFDECVADLFNRRALPA